MIFAANELMKFGVPNVLIKGGHFKSKKVHDIFVNKKEIKIFTNNRFQYKKYSWHWLYIINSDYLIFLMWKNLKEIL